MIVDKKTEIQKLIDSRELDSDEKIESFENAIQALSENLSCDDVICLCKAFCDDTQNEEAMFGLIHLIEQLRGKDYLREIALCTPDMKDAHDWAMTLNKRILNSADYLDMYISVIDLLGESEKDKILSLLNDIKNDNPSRFAKKIDYLIGRIY